MFYKVAQAAQALVDSNEKTAPQALLDLAGLLNAILYTQGDTGVSGAMDPIQPVELHMAPNQTSTQTLKPLLEALSTIGSGRLQIVVDAINQGFFADLRLVLPALRALDDAHDIAQRIECDVLPQYGKALTGELTAQLEVGRGRAGDARRLRLLHSLDPVAARPIIEQALEDGSKELRVAAITCLGRDERDVSLLLQQATAKAKDVRVAALSALLQVETEATLAVLKARVPKDLDSLIQPLRDTQWPALRAWMVEETRAQLRRLLGTHKEKDQGNETERLLQWLDAFVGRVDDDATPMLNELFDHMALLEKVQSIPSGRKVNERVAALMASGDATLAMRLIDRNMELTGTALRHAFLAARRTLDPAEVYSRFAPNPEAARQHTATNSAARGRWEDVRAAIQSGGQAMWQAGSRQIDDLPVLDSRWIDTAIALDDVALVEAVSRPGHPALLTYLTAKAAAEKADDTLPRLLGAMIRCTHPLLVETVLGMLAAANDGVAQGRAHTQILHISREIPALPATAIAPLEALLSTLHWRLVDQLVNPIQQLKDRHRPAK